MSKFKVGDRVRIVGRSSDGPTAKKWIGRTATIDRVTRAEGSIPGRWRHGQTVYHLDIAPGDECLPAKNMRRADDGDKPVSWSECAWQPSQVHA